MVAHCPLYHTIAAQIAMTTAPFPLPAPSHRRLTLLVTGLVAAQSAILAQIAADLFALRLTGATTPESVNRRLRRTLSDPLLIAEECYEPALRRVIAWPPAADRQPLILVIDESSKADVRHLFRISLPYWGTALPLVWTIWEQHVPLPHGAYWAMIDATLDRLAALLPAGRAVCIVADRAYAVAPLLDRLTARGWHWVIRITTTGSHRFRDAHGREWALKEWLARRVAAGGQQGKGRGAVLKGAGWRSVSLVASWTIGEQEPLVVISDRPARWQRLDTSARRFWIEPGFRCDKTRGWHWEASQVQGLAHHAVVLLAMAWASLLARCLGVEQARAALRRLAARPVRGAPPQPRHARESLFTLGVRVTRERLYHRRQRPVRWRLPEITALSWSDRWHQAQADRVFSQTVRP